MSAAFHRNAGRLAAALPAQIAETLPSARRKRYRPGLLSGLTGHILIMRR
jgi:hypothetical protein